MAYSEKKIEELERSVPERAIQAVKAAYRQNFNAGLSTLIVENAILYRVNADFSRTPISKCQSGFLSGKARSIN
jgi:hypothetical protein